MELAVELEPDVVLMDIHMPGGGIAAADEISRSLPNCAVVMLTYSRDDDDLFGSLRAGARGYLLKDMDPDRLGPALRGVLAGEAALPRSLVSRVLEEFQGRSRRKLFVRAKRPTQLTSREWEVMELLRDGLSTVGGGRDLPAADGIAVAGLAAGVRAVADGVEAALRVQP